MKLGKIAEIIEKEFPLSCAYAWDNCGLLLGDRERDIKTVLLSLDITENVAKEAKNVGADLILSHHPILFDGAKKITRDTPEGRTILTLLENNTCAYSAHTNCDVAENGINARLATLFDLLDTEFLEEDGLGRIGNLKKTMPFGDFALFTKNIIIFYLNCQFVDF